jgi:putative ABC transport system ATP-binding protein
MKQPFIRVMDITRSYQKGPVSVHALQGVSFEAARGEFISIVGRSGSGKSTLLNILGGLDTATSGNVFIGDRDLTRMKRKDLTLHRRTTVGMVFQSFNLIPSLSALDNVALALIFGGVERRLRSKKARDLLVRLGLEERLDHKPSELSGGEAQRVAIARALANDPKVLLADEPTGNLDSATSREIIGLMSHLNRDRGLTVFMVTHDEPSAKAVSSRLIHLLDGKIQKKKTVRGTA